MNYPNNIRPMGGSNQTHYTQPTAYLNAPAQQPPQDQCVRPEWIEDLTTFYNGRISRQFVLHFNIIDYVLDLDAKEEIGRGQYIRKGNVFGNPNQLQLMREYLHTFLFQQLRCQSIYTYSLAGGLKADDSQSGGAGAPLTREKYGKAMGELYKAWSSIRPQKQQKQQKAQQEEKEIELPDSISETFKLLEHMLHQSYYSSASPAQDELEAPIAVILDYVEKLIPYHLGEGQGDREQLQALEVIQRWALDPLIRKTNNIIILLTTNIGLIPTSVHSEGSGCRSIRVPLPNENEREAFISYKLAKSAKRERLHPFVPLDGNDFGTTDAEKAHTLSRLTQGMRLSDIDNTSRRIIVESLKANIPSIMLKSDVQRVKSEVIEAQSAQLLEIVPPVRGFKEIGGLQGLKDYLSKRTQLMHDKENSPLVPSGLLLAGPPGTGKTIIAEALATESGFNLVKMRNIRDKWVGSSERNLELVISLLKDLYPVVVFVDEIDQAMGQRDTGQGGDSGVSARMFGRILEEMSNASNRGKILWVAATNRADLLDDALLRRFDRVIPLLTPDVEESCHIFATMLKTISKQSGSSLPFTYGHDLAQSGNTDEKGRPSPTPEDLAKFRPVAEITANLGLTGAGIEIVVRRAIEMAYEEKLDKDGRVVDRTIPQIESHHLIEAVHDFKPNHNRISYDYQSLLAIRACNFLSVIPHLPRSETFENIQGPDSQIDLQRLDEEIVRHRRLLHGG